MGDWVRCSTSLVTFELNGGVKGDVVVTTSWLADLMNLDRGSGRVV